MTSSTRWATVSLTTRRSMRSSRRWWSTTSGRSRHWRRCRPGSAPNARSATSHQADDHNRDRQDRNDPCGQEKPSPNGHFDRPPRASKGNTQGDCAETVVLFRAAGCVAGPLQFRSSRWDQRRWTRPRTRSPAGLSVLARRGMFTSIPAYTRAEIPAI